MAKAVRLANGRQWSSQKGAVDHFREIRNRYADEVTIDDAQDHADLVALLERYDAAHAGQAPKIGIGVASFEVRTNQGSGGATRGFWLRRIDGSETDFSFLWAVRGVSKSQGQEFTDACRAAVDRQLKAAKRRFFEAHADGDGLVECELTGVLVSFESAHLDHAYPTFETLVVTFRAARGWEAEIPAGTLSMPTDRQLTTTFSDTAVSEAFIAFHQKAATLRVIASGANLSLAASQRRPKIKRLVQLLD
jgi:hypothetical protein